MSNVQFINPPDIAKPNGYTHVVEVTSGKIIFISGQVALDRAGNMVGAGDFRAQSQQVFENIRSSLAAVGADFSHVIKLNLYMLDADNLPILREVRDQFVNTDQPPASTALEVSRFFREGFLVEVEAMAVIP